MVSKIILTGAAGLLGLNLLTLISPKKYNIVVIDKNKKNLEIAKGILPQIKTVLADLSVPSPVWEKEFYKTACVIQMQAQISSIKYAEHYKNNVTSVKNVLAVIEKYKVKKLIHISSSVVISKSQDLYTKTKTLGEELVKKSSANYTILRPPLMYGCFDIKHLAPIIRSLEKTFIFPIPGSGKYIRQPLFVEDLVNVILKLIERKPERKIYNIIGKEKIYFINLIKEIAKQRKLRRIYMPLPIWSFVLALKAYNFIKGKKVFVPSQLFSLMAGDEFPIEDWEKEFSVKYTPFKEGVKKMLSSKYHDYDLMMKK